jgi:hypothetical protein
VALVAGSAAIGALISVSGDSGRDPSLSADSQTSAETGVISADSSENEVIGLKTASIGTVSSSKGNFNGEIAKAVSANPMQTMSVAYINGASVSAGINETAVQGNYPAPASDALAYSEPTVVENTIELASLGDASGSTSVQKTLPPEPVDEQVVLRQGETLIQRLIELGVTTASAHAVAGQLSRSTRDALSRGPNLYGNPGP